jgi:hypothetical protein
MSRGTRLVACLAGVALAVVLLGPSARAQRCPFMMQAWYQVQMQQYQFHAQQLHAQRFASPTPIGGGTGFQSHRLQPTTFHSASVSPHPQMHSTTSVHQSLSVRLHNLEPHPLLARPFGHGEPLSGRLFPAHRLEVHRTFSTETHTDLHMRLTAHFHTMTSRKPIPSEHFVGNRTTELRPHTVLHSQHVQHTVQRPVVKAGYRVSCMGGCHFHQNQPVDVTRIMPQQPANPLLAQFLRMQRPPAPLRAMPAPDPFLVQLLQRQAVRPVPAQRVALPAGAPARADMPPWLRAMELPPALPPALLVGKLDRTPADQTRATVPDESTSPGAAASIPPQGRVRIDPFSPAAAQEASAPPLVARVAPAPALPPSRGPVAQPLWPAPIVLAAPESEAVTVTAGGLSPEDVLEPPALPPSPAAVLPPPPLEDVVAELPDEPAETDPVLVPPPLPSRSRQ